MPGHPEEEHRVIKLEIRPRPPGVVQLEAVRPFEGLPMPREHVRDPNGAALPKRRLSDAPGHHPAGRLPERIEEQEGGGPSEVDELRRSLDDADVGPAPTHTCGVAKREVGEMGIHLHAHSVSDAQARGAADHAALSASDVDENVVRAESQSLENGPDRRVRQRLVLDGVGMGDTIVGTVGAHVQAQLPRRISKFSRVPQQPSVHR
jgi:hypothetical protein